MTEKDYYKILGIDRNADHRQVREAYRRLAFEYHPDRNNGDPRAVEKMKELNEAYAVLSDPHKRQRYDSLSQQYGYDAYDRFRQGYSDEDIFRGSDVNQIFEEMARQFGFRHFQDLFREFYGPGYRTFEFRRPGVFGRGFIFTNIGFGRQGRQEVGSSRPGLGTGLLGALARFIVGKMFKGGAQTGPTDRHDTITISPDDARIGAKVSYLDKENYRQFIVTIPKGIQEGQVIRLRGAAQNDSAFGLSGDLYLRVQFRRSLFEKAKLLYERMKARRLPY